MALSIGQLNLQLVGDARGLQKMLPDMNRLGKAINSLSKSQESGSARAVNALNRQEQAVRRQLNAVQNLNAQIKRTGGPSNLLGSNTRAMQAFTREMSKGTLTTAQFNRANDRLTGTLARSGRSLRSFNAKVKSDKVSKLGATLRNLESASVLAVGPLSGLGARIRAVGAIAGRSALLVALLFGGITLGIVVLAKFAAGAIKAASAMEKINARLTVATGSAVMANRSFSFVSKTAKSMGLDVLTSADAFSQLAAATRGTAAQGAITQRVFKGIAAASAALRLSTDQVQGAFRAVQQIASKGRVQSEELIGQLAERIPNAIQIAADAFGTNQAALLEMVQNGLVPATAFLDKFGKELTKVFSKDAAKNLESLAGKTNALSNAQLGFSLELDRVLGLTELWKDILELTTRAINFMTSAIEPATKFVKALGVEMVSTVRSLNLRLWTAFGNKVGDTKIKIKALGDESNKAKNKLTEFQTKAVSTLAGKTAKANTAIKALVGGFGLVTPEARKAAASLGIFLAESKEIAPEMIAAAQALDLAQRKLNSFSSIAQIMDEVATPIEKVTLRIAELQRVAEARRLRFFDGDTAGFDEQMAAIERLKTSLETLGLNAGSKRIAQLAVNLDDLKTGATQTQKSIRTFKQSLLEFGDTSVQAADGTRKLNNIGRIQLALFSNLSREVGFLDRMKQLSDDALTPMTKLTLRIKALTELRKEIKLEFAKEPAKLLEGVQMVDREISKLTNKQFLISFKLKNQNLAGSGILEAFRGQMQKIQGEMNTVTQQFVDGIISPAAFEASMTRLQGLKGRLESLNAVSVQFGSAITQGFEDAIFSGKKLGDVLKALIIDLIKIALRAAILKPLGNALGASLGSALGFAGGGKTPSNQAFVVGEKGPEVLSFGKSGTVTPNDVLARSARGGQAANGNASNVTQNITFTTTIKDDVRAIIVESLPAIASATVQSLRDETQRTGILKTFG